MQQRQAQLEEVRAADAKKYALLREDYQIAVAAGAPCLSICVKFDQSSSVCPGQPRVCMHVRMCMCAEMFSLLLYACTHSHITCMCISTIDLVESCFVVCDVHDKQQTSQKTLFVMYITPCAGFNEIYIHVYHIHVQTVLVWKRMSAWSARRGSRSTSIFAGKICVNVHEYITAVA